MPGQVKICQHDEAGKHVHYHALPVVRTPEGGVVTLSSDGTASVASKSASARAAVTTGLGTASIGSTGCQLFSFGEV